MRKKIIFSMAAILSLGLGAMLMQLPSANAAFTAQTNLVARFALETPASSYTYTYGSRDIKLSIAGTGALNAQNNAPAGAPVSTSVALSGQNGLQIAAINSATDKLGAMTFSTWLKMPIAQGDWSPVITFAAGSSVSVGGTSFNSLAITMQSFMELFDGSTYRLNWWDGASPWLDTGGNWLHVAVAVPASGSGFTLYVNGTAHTRNFTSLNAGDAMRALMQQEDFRIDLGMTSRANQYRAAGSSFYDVRIYNRVLSAAELTEVRNFATEPDPSANTIASVTVDGNAFADFSPAKFNYSIRLQEGTVRVPEIVPSISHGADEYLLEITKAKNISQSTIFKITDRASGESNTYTFSFYTVSDANLIANYKLGKDFKDGVSGQPATASGSPSFSGGGAALGSADYLTLPNNTLSKESFTELTFQVWLKTTAAGDWNHFMALQGTGYEFSLSVNGFAPRNDGSGFDYQTPARTIATNDNNWHLMTFTMDSAQGVLYIDGVRQYTMANVNWVAIINYFSNNNAVNIYLARNIAGDNQFACQLKDFRIYNAALSADDIASYIQSFNDGGISALVNGGALTVDAAATGGAAFQFWVKESVALFSGNTEDGAAAKSVWVAKNGGAFTPQSYTVIPDAFLTAEQVQVLVRVRFASGEVKDYYKVFFGGDYVVKIALVVSGGQSTNNADVIKLPQSGAELTVQTYGIAADVYTLAYSDGREIISGSSNVLSGINFDFTGSVTLAVTADGATEYFAAYIFDNSADYAYINGVDIDISGDTVTITPDITITGSDGYTVNYYVGNKTDRQPLGETGVINGITSDGYYIYTVQVTDSYGKVTDTYSSEFLKGGAGNSLDGIKTAYSASDFSGGKLTIGASSDQGLEYMYIRFDAKGEYIVKSWTQDDGTFEVAPNYIGIYKYYLRVRTAGAVCSYEQQKTITVNYNVDYSSDIEIYSEGELSARRVNKITVVNKKAGEDTTLYKFVVVGPGLYKTEQWFSLNSTLYFVPNKPGVYTVEIRLITQGSYGYADDVQYVKDITVI